LTALYMVRHGWRNVTLMWVASGVFQVIKWVVKGISIDGCMQMNYNSMNSRSLHIMYAVF